MEFDLAYISELLQALLLAILPVLATAGVRWLLNAGAVAKAKLTTEQQEIVSKIVTVAVLAAEQLGVTAKLKDEYLDKKFIAVNIVTDHLEALGLKMDAQYIADSIEAAVMKEFNRWDSMIEPQG